MSFVQLMNKTIEKNMKKSCYEFWVAFAGTTKVSSIESIMKFDQKIID
jgi:hypothetical protein